MLFSGGLVVSSGVNNFAAPLRVDTELHPGLKVVVLLSGRLSISVGDDCARDLCGPVALTLRSQANFRRNQVYTPGIPVRYALVQMRQDMCGPQLSQALDSVAGQSAVAPLLLASPAGRLLRSLAQQIMTCPIHGPERELFLGGKALQLASLAVSSCMSQAQLNSHSILSSREAASITAARDMLIDAMRDPPSLDQLAQSCGTNPRKLNDGFRRMYGATVFDFLQEYRLEQAYKLISSGEMTVSQAAYHVGYGAAHFATVFRRRFGISPSSLR